MPILEIFTWSAAELLCGCLWGQGGGQGDGGGTGEWVSIGTGFEAVYSVSAITAPLKESVLYTELLLSPEERILLCNKTFENHWHKMILIYGKIRVDEWHFSLKDIFKKWNSL